MEVAGCAQAEICLGKISLEAAGKSRPRTRAAHHGFSSRASRLALRLRYESLPHKL